MQKNININYNSSPHITHLEIRPITLIVSDIRVHVMSRRKLYPFHTHLGHCLQDSVEVFVHQPDRWNLSCAFLFPPPCPHILRKIITYSSIRTSLIRLRPYLRVSKVQSCRNTSSTILSCLWHLTRFPSNNSRKKFYPLCIEFLYSCLSRYFSAYTITIVNPIKA